MELELSQQTQTVLYILLFPSPQDNGGEVLLVGAVVKSDNHCLHSLKPIPLLLVYMSVCVHLDVAIQLNRTVSPPTLLRTGSIHLDLI